jgi:hypothetical protein
LHTNTVLRCLAARRIRRSQRACLPRITDQCTRLRKIHQEPVASPRLPPSFDRSRQGEKLGGPTPLSGNASTRPTAWREQICSSCPWRASPQFTDTRLRRCLPLSVPVRPCPSLSVPVLFRGPAQGKQQIKPAAPAHVPASRSHPRPRSVRVPKLAQAWMQMLAGPDAPGKRGTILKLQAQGTPRRREKHKHLAPLMFAGLLLILPLVENHPAVHSSS